jgi:hypothetical protein
MVFAKLFLRLLLLRFFDILVFHFRFVRRFWLASAILLLDFLDLLHHKFLLRFLLLNLLGWCGSILDGLSWRFMDLKEQVIFIFACFEMKITKLLVIVRVFSECILGQGTKYRGVLKYWRKGGEVVLPFIKVNLHIYYHVIKSERLY